MGQPPVYYPPPHPPPTRRPQTHAPDATPHPRRHHRGTSRLGAHESETGRLVHHEHVVVAGHKLALAAQGIRGPLHVAEIHAAAAHVAVRRDELRVRERFPDAEVLDLESRIYRAGRESLAKRAEQMLRPELVDQVAAVGRETQRTEADSRRVVADAREDRPVLERPIHIEQIERRGGALVGVERAWPRATQRDGGFADPRRARRIHVVDLPRQREEHGRRALRRLRAIGEIHVGPIGEHEQRSRERGERCRAVRIGGGDLDVVGVVPPYHVVERVVLGEAPVAEAVVAHAHGVNHPRQIRANSPARQQKAGMSDHIANCLHDRAIHRVAPQPARAKVVGVAVVALVAQVTQRVHLEIRPSHAPQAVVHRDHEIAHRGGVGAIHDESDPVSPRGRAGRVAHELVRMRQRVRAVVKRHVGPDGGLEATRGNIAGDDAKPGGELRIRIEPVGGRADRRALIPVVDLQVRVAERLQHARQDVGRVFHVAPSHRIEERIPRRPSGDRRPPRGVRPRMERAQPAMHLVEARPKADGDFPALGVEAEGRAVRAGLRQHYDMGRKVHRDHPVARAIVHGAIEQVDVGTRCGAHHRHDILPGVHVAGKGLRARGDVATHANPSARGGELDHLRDRVVGRVGQHAHVNARAAGLDDTAKDRPAFIGEHEAIGTQAGGGGHVGRSGGLRTQAWRGRQHERGERNPLKHRRDSHGIKLPATRRTRDNAQVAPP